MTSWDLFDTVEWLLRECRDQGAIGPDAEPVMISLTGEGSSDCPPGEAVKEAIDFCRKQAFEFFPDGWVRLRAGSSLESDDGVAVYATKQGIRALESRLKARNA